MEKLVILEYSTGSVHIYDVSPDTNVDEEYICNMGFRASDCSWMLKDGLSIHYHRGILK